MVGYFIELCLFFGPGILSEILFCKLKTRNSDLWVKVGRMLFFSFLCLGMRCVISLAGGYGAIEIGVLFHGISNVFKYCLIAFVGIIVLPPSFLILEKLFVFMRDKKDSDSNEPVPR